jgi:branched-chain amino acid transport system permease protein
LDFSQYLVTLCYAGLLSLLGIAVVLRHRASGIPDFSTVSYLGLGVLVTGITVLSGLNLYLGPVFAFAVGCLAGFAQYRGVLSVMERRGDGAVKRTLSTIGVQLLAGGLLGGIVYCFVELFGVTAYYFHFVQGFDFTFMELHGIFFVVPVVCLGVYASLLLLSRKPLGARVTASEENPELAMIQGIDPWRVKTQVWVLTGGLACAAGSLFPPFIHLYPDSQNLLIPILSVGVLAGFESLPLSVAAAFLIGIAEIQGTLWLQINFGTWMGEFRPLIPAIILCLTMLLIPKGLVELKTPIRDAINYLRGSRRRVLSLLAVLLFIAGALTIAENRRVEVARNTQEGWINVANSVGRAGATIYGDAAEVGLPESLYYSNVKWPQNPTTIRNLVIFSATIRNAKATIIYRHEGMLYLFVDEERAFVYDPAHDNYGR